MDVLKDKPKKQVDPLTVQEIVDLYWLEKNNREMTIQIDFFNNYHNDNFWAELAVDLEKFCDHVDDWTIFTEMVCNYHLEKDDMKTQEQADLLLKFAKWVIDGVEYVNIDESEMKIKIDDYLEEMED